ncbi:MAG: hypothetical protein P8J78_09350 [Maricaulis sp.]|nr:hypothetical protein [Maricaulis sp.]MDG2044803.1 hypothetical protein [Maricaulis sp.]
MLGKIWRVLTWPFRAIPWYVWLGALAVAAWFGRNILLIIASVIAFNPIPVPPIFQGEPETILEAREQDLDYFNHVRRNERSLDDAGRARFDAQLDLVRADMATMSDAEFQLGLARVMALTDNGHSNASATRMVQPFERMPFRTAVLDGQLHVLRVREGFEDLLGAQVTHINGVPAMQAMYRFRDAFGGNDPFFESFAPLLIETPVYLEAVDLSAGELTYSFILADGNSQDRTLAPVAVEEAARRRFSGDLPMHWKMESDHWIAFQPSGDPLYLRHPDSDYWLEYLDDGDIAYLNIRANFSDAGEESLSDWVARMEVELRAAQPGVIIVDQRFNGGGDLTQTEPLMHALADIVGEDGRVYLLANGNTFSAGIVNLAMAKETAPERVVLVGEEIGDRLQFWAEGWWYSLKNSGYRARYSTGYYDLQNGCSGIFICHWGSLDIFPVIVDDLDIDIEAPMTFADYAAGRDAGLEAVFAAEAAR